MELKRQVCTLRQSEILVTLGIKRRESYFYWHFGEVSETFVIIDNEHSNINQSDLPAFTVAELGIILKEFTVFIEFRGERWLIMYEHATRDPERKNYGTGTTVYSISCDTQAQAYAYLLIYLIENELQTSQECNERLTEHQ